MFKSDSPAVPAVVPRAASLISEKLSTVLFGGVKIKDVITSTARRVVMSQSGVRGTFWRREELRESGSSEHRCSIIKA